MRLEIAKFVDALIVVLYHVTEVSDFNLHGIISCVRSLFWHLSAIATKNKAELIFREVLKFG